MTEFRTPGTANLRRDGGKLRARRTARLASRVAILALALVLAPRIAAQEPDRVPDEDDRLDSLYIAEVEQAHGRPKVLHAEPLYIDLIRDLGARRGEAEWNVGFGLTDTRDYDRYEFLIEYEFAPIDRLGLEIEVPATFHSGRPEVADVPADRIESLKLAAQWTFLVSPRASTSLALGYINELVFADLDSWGSEPLFEGNKVNPFVVAAKRWGPNFHTLLYAGPSRTFVFDGADVPWSFEANWNVHYMLPGTRNFVGVELNQRFREGSVGSVLRPQMRLGLADNLLVGLALGIPLREADERLGVFMRIIWEPGHSHRGG